MSSDSSHSIIRPFFRSLYYDKLRTRNRNNSTTPLKKVTAGSIVNSDTRKSYPGIASRGYVHRHINHSEKLFSDGKGNHITGLEGFRGYLKRKLVFKSGMRREKLPLYLRE
jgi:hypothetical protein